ncbi:MAG: hypothetical protein LQ349_002327 [Xanthoria aureola]|nr:MAG: hypothetical protein LQ349_002327 [Xanthoria aureola]
MQWISFEFRISSRRFLRLYKLRGNKLGWEIKNVIVIIKAKHTNATIKKQTIDDLSMPEWIKVIELIQREVGAYKMTIPEAAISFHIAVQADKELVKKARQAAALASTELSPEPSTSTTNPYRRATRTDHLQNTAVMHQDDNKAVGNFNKQLVDKWRCWDERCPNAKDNHGWCFIDGAGDHYSIDHAQQMKWAKAIQQREPYIDVEHPPRSLYILWTRDQGPVGSQGKKPIKTSQREEVKDIMEQMRELKRDEMQERLDEFQMQRMERLGQRPIAQQASQASQSCQLAQPWQQLASFQQPFPYSFYQQPLPQSQAFLPNVQQQQAGITSPPTQPTQPLKERSSSPIGPLQQEPNIITAFFAWKINREPEQHVKDTLATVRGICQAKYYKLRHLKAMSDPIQPFYQRAIDNGIPDGIALDFKQDIHDFKPQWRQAGEAVNGLIQMRGQ